MRFDTRFMHVALRGWNSFHAHIPTQCTVWNVCTQLTNTLTSTLHVGVYVIKRIVASSSDSGSKKGAHHKKILHYKIVRPKLRQLKIVNSIIQILLLKLIICNRMCCWNRKHVQTWAIAEKSVRINLMHFQFVELFDNFHVADLENEHFERQCISIEYTLHTNRQMKVGAKERQ